MSEINQKQNDEIIGVAIKHKDLVIGLPKPNRHHHVIYYMVEVLGITHPVGNRNTNSQGFYLADGTYLTRKQAHIYAREIGQCVKPLNKSILFSEDLW